MVRKFQCHSEGPGTVILPDVHTEFAYRCIPDVTTLVRGICAATPQYGLSVAFPLRISPPSIRDNGIHAAGASALNHGHFLRIGNKIKMP